MLPMILFTLGGFGPTIAACLCMKKGFSWNNLKHFLFRNTKKNWLFFLGAILLETLFFALCSNGLNEFVPKSPIAILVVLIVFLQAAVLYGGNEELGWRGTMQAILQEKFPFPAATLTVGVTWVLWHIPLWFIAGNSHQGMSFLTFAIMGLALSYWLATLWNVTGAVFFCMLLHGWTNTLMGLLQLRENSLYYGILGFLTLVSLFVNAYYAKRKSGLE